jgi:hypothetical protein
VFSTLTHTIAGGSLLTAGAAGAKRCNPFNVSAQQPGQLGIASQQNVTAHAALCAVIASLLTGSNHLNFSSA